MARTPSVKSSSAQALSSVAGALLCLAALTGCNLVVGLDHLRVEPGDAGGGARADAGEMVESDGSVDETTIDAAAGDARIADGDAPSRDSGNGAPDAAPDSDSGPGACSGLTCDGACVAADSLTHCGTCDHDCTQLPNVTGTVACNAGRCSFAASACAPGFAHCSANADDGCEVDITQAAHCGQCTMACGGAAPLCAATGSGQYSCESGCSATAPTLCGQSCVDTAASAAHCGKCNNPCPAVTGGQAVCKSSQCDFTCNSDRHRCGSSCAPNDSITQCGESCVACPQPTGGTASCVNGACALSCGQGYLKSGSTCVSQYLYVSTTGNDANSGTSLVTPLRSFKRAMTIAVAGQTVRFVSGTYGSATGDDFAQPVPNGVNLERNGTAGGVVFQSSGGSLVLAGDANLSNVRLDGFATPLGITNGTQTLVGVAITNSTGSVIVSGNAKVTLQSVTLSGAPSSTEMMLVQDTASVNWSSGSLTSNFAACNAATSGIRALGSAKLTLTGVSLYGKWNSGGETAPFYIVSGGAIEMSNGTFNNECGATTTTMVIRASTSATLNLTNCYFGGMLTFEPLKSVKVRQSSFHANAGLYLTGTGHPVIDLGRSGDPGGNSFQMTVQTAVTAFGSNNLIIDAAGNTWVASQQGADANGQYAAGSTLMNPTSGRNFALIGSNNLVRF